MSTENTTKEEYSVPDHIALIPDGNRRWARENDAASIEGHRQGLENFKQFSQWCRDAGVRYLTAFGFSSENWNRSEKEVRYLCELFERHLQQNASEFQKKGVFVNVIGDTSAFPESLQETIETVREKTRKDALYTLNLALGYGGRWDITEAARAIAHNNKEEDITETTVAQHLASCEVPAIDLLIRTGGERRISNFFLWQLAYAELYFIDTYWPDFSVDHFHSALNDYARRQRRFGR